MSADGIKWHCAWNVQKWDEDAVAFLTRKLARDPFGFEYHAARIAPYEDNDIDGNLLTTAGLTRISNLIIGTGATQAATASATRIGVGNGVTAVAIGDTDLSAAAGSTNRFFTILDSTPTVSAGQMTFIATFVSANGNFAWQEFGIDVTAAASSGTTVNAPLLNHKLSSQGTKTVGQSWTATATITLS